MLQKCGIFPQSGLGGGMRSPTADVVRWNCNDLHCDHSLYMYFYADVVDATVTSNCSFPFTYDGGLFHSCIDNMTDVSTAEHPLACIAVNATTAVCDVPGTLYTVHRFTAIH